MPCEQEQSTGSSVLRQSTSLASFENVERASPQNRSYVFVHVTVIFGVNKSSVSVTIPHKKKSCTLHEVVLQISPGFWKFIKKSPQAPSTGRKKRKVTPRTSTVEMEEYADTHRTWADVPCEELLCEFVIILTSRCWHVQLMMCVLRSVVAVIGAFCFRAAHAVRELARFIKLERVSSNVGGTNGLHRWRNRAPSVLSDARRSRCDASPSGQVNRILSAFWSVKLPPHLRADTLGHRRGISLWNEDVIHSL